MTTVIPAQPHPARFVRAPRRRAGSVLVEHQASSLPWVSAAASACPALRSMCTAPIRGQCPGGGRDRRGRDRLLGRQVTDCRRVPSKRPCPSPPDPPTATSRPRQRSARWRAPAPRRVECFRQPHARCTGQSVVFYREISFVGGGVNRGESSRMILAVYRVCMSQ